MLSHTKVKILLLGVFSAALSACQTISQSGITGDYKGSLEKNGGDWTCMLAGDGSFEISGPMILVLNETQSPLNSKEWVYGGRWKLAGTTLILERADGKVEKMQVERHFGILQLKPEKQGQPVFIWKDRWRQTLGEK